MNNCALIKAAARKPEHTDHTEYTDHTEFMIPCPTHLSEKRSKKCFDFVVREKMCIFVGDEDGVFDRIYGLREDDARGAAGAVAWVAVCRP